MWFISIFISRILVWFWIKCIASPPPPPPPPPGQCGVINLLFFVLSFFPPPPPPPLTVENPHKNSRYLRSLRIAELNVCSVQINILVSAICTYCTAYSATFVFVRLLPEPFPTPAAFFKRQQLVFVFFSKSQWFVFINSNNWDEDRLLLISCTS